MRLNPLTTVALTAVIFVAGCTQYQRTTTRQQTEAHLSNATNYQTEDQAEEMLLDYTRVAVRIVENRHKAEERPWSLSDLVCRN